MITAADNAYERIRDMFLTGQFAPGQRISQSKLARQLGCSTVPVVESLRLLESEGLLEKEPRKMARMRKLTPRELQGVYMVRESLEAVTARLCAQVASDEQIDVLRDLNKRYEQAIDDNESADRLRLEVEIHRHIALSADCGIIAEELSRLMLIEKAVGQVAHSHVPTDLEKHSHHPVIQAISDHDCEMAEYFMRRHIRIGRDGVSSELFQQHQNTGQPVA